MSAYRYGLYLLPAALLAACAQAPSGEPSYETSAGLDTASVRAPSPQTAKAGERLGTGWGDEVSSPVRQVDLRRTASEPAYEANLRYANKAYSGRSINAMSLAAGMIELRVESDRGQRLPLFRDGSQYYLRGTPGQAYRLVYRNNSSKTYEIVASVDGLDVLNGSSASRYNNGYVLSPRSTLTIEGFRKNQNSVASFVFSSPQDAYANHSASGSIRNTGIIGTAVYELYDPNKRRRSEPQAFPADNGKGYAPPPR